MTTIPKTKFGLIGGSGTWGARIPEDLNREAVSEVTYYREGFETPFGRSTGFKLFSIMGENVLRVAMHGMHLGDSNLEKNQPWIVAKQIAWVFKEAGVKWAITEGSVGGIYTPDKERKPLSPGSLVIPDDFMMLWRPGEDSPLNMNSYRLAEPFCPELRGYLLEAANKESFFEAIYDQGNYCSWPWGRFETAAEIQMLAQLGANIVGMTIGHEAPLMRSFGIHFASVNIVSNFAEGITGDWVEMDMAEFYFKCAHAVGTVTIDAITAAIQHQDNEACRCDNYLLTPMQGLPVKDA